MTIRRHIMTAAVILLPAIVIFGQDPRAEDSAGSLRDDPGFIDFSHHQVLTEDDLEVHISVKDPMIKLVAEATRESDPDLADVLEQLRAVEVHVFTVPEVKREAVYGDIRDLARGLEDDGWTEAITIRLRGARGYIFLRFIESRPVGLAAMYLDDQKEAVYVNIVGKIDAAQVGRLASKFDLELLSQAITGSASGLGRPN